MPALVQTISLNLTSLSPDSLFKYGLTLVANLPNVDKYKSIQPSLEEGQLLINTFGTAVSNAMKGGEAERILRDALRHEVEALILAWSRAAITATPDDVVSWSKAHFNLTKAERTPRQPLDVPRYMNLTDGPVSASTDPLRGSIKVMQNEQGGSRAYVYEYALVPLDGSEPNWHYCLCTGGSALIENLLKGRQYMFRCGAWNGTTPPKFGPVAMRYAQ